MNDREIVKKWFEYSYHSYRGETESREEAIDYLVEDANSQCGTNIPKKELREIAEWCIKQ